MAQVISKAVSLYQGAFVGVVRAPVLTCLIGEQGGLRGLCKVCRLYIILLLSSNAFEFLPERVRPLRLLFRATRSNALPPVRSIGAAKQSTNSLSREAEVHAPAVRNGVKEHRSIRKHKPHVLTIRPVHRAKARRPRRLQRKRDAVFEGCARVRRRHNLECAWWPAASLRCERRNLQSSILASHARWKWNGVHVAVIATTVAKRGVPLEQQGVASVVFREHGVHASKR